MSITYNPTTNFGAKDSLPANDPDKVIVGAEFTSEFAAIQAAFALAAPTSNPTFSGTATYSDLTVSGSFTSRGIDDNATSTAITIDADENVGIGTPPSFPLDVAGNNTTIFRATNSSATGTFRVFHEGSLVSIGSVGGSNNELAFKTGGATGTERMVIDSSGKVGIGRTPQVFCDVAGIVSSTEYRLRDAADNTRSVLAMENDDLVVQTGTGNGTRSVIVKTENTERMRIDSSGNVGIGTSDPMENLSIGATPSQAGLTLAADPIQCFLRYNNYYSGSTQVSDASKGSASLGLGKGSDGVITLNTAAAGAGTPTEAVRIASNGNVGIGTSDPNFSTFDTTAGGLHIKDSEIAALRLEGANHDFYVTSRDDGNYLYGRGYYPTIISTDSRERMRIDGDGNLLVGVSSGTGNRLYVKGYGSNNNYNAVKVINGDDDPMFSIRGDGVISTGTATLSPYNNTTSNAANVYVSSSGNLARSTSSRRYKENIRNYTGSLDALRPVMFNSINEDDDKEYAGFIAEEVHEAGLHEFVEYDDQDRPDAVNYANMAALLVKEIQDLKAEVAALKGA